MHILFRFIYLPKPQRFRNDRPQYAVDEQKHQLMLCRQLKVLPVAVVEEEKQWPKQNEIKQTHKAKKQRNVHFVLVFHLAL